MKNKKVPDMPIVPPEDGEIERDNAHYRLNPSGHRELVLKKKGGDEETLNELASDIDHLLEYMEMGEASNEALSAEQPQLERNVHSRPDKTFTPQLTGSPQDRTLTYGDTITNMTGATKRAEDVSNVRSLKDEDSDKYILSGDTQIESFTGTAGIAISPVAYETYDNEDEDGEDGEDNNSINETGLKMTKKYIVEWEPEFKAGEYHPGDHKMKSPTGHGLAKKTPKQEKVGHYDTELTDGGEPFGAEHNETAAMCDVEESGVEDKPQGVHQSRHAKASDGHTTEVGHDWPSQPKHKGGGVGEPVAGTRYSDGGTLQGSSNPMEWSREKVGQLLGEDVDLQGLFDSYARDAQQVDLPSFSALCEAHGLDVMLDEASLLTMMENNNEFVFHEYVDSEGSFWLGERAVKKKTLSESPFFYDGPEGDNAKAADMGDTSMGGTPGGEVIGSAGDTEVKKLSRVEDKMVLGKKMRNCLADRMMCMRYGDIYAVYKNGRPVAAATTDGRDIYGIDNKSLSKDQFVQFAGMPIEWGSDSKEINSMAESMDDERRIISEVQFRSPEEESFLHQSDEYNASMDDMDNEVDAEDMDFQDDEYDMDRQYGGGSFGGEDVIRTCPGCGYEGVEESCPECGMTTLGSESDIADTDNAEDFTTADSESAMDVDLMDSLQKFMHTARHLIETQNSPGTKLNEAWDSLIGVVHSHQIPSVVSNTLAKMRNSIDGFTPTIAESGKHVMDSMGGAGLQSKSLKVSPDLEEQPNVDDMEEHGQKIDLIRRKPKNTYETTPVMKGTEKGLTGHGNVKAEARWVGANANALRENIDKLAKRVKLSLSESAERLPRGKHSVSFSVLVTEGGVVNATPKRSSLAESLADLEEVLQFNDKNDVAFTASFKNASGATVLTKRIPLAVINRRGPIVAEGKMIFRFPKHARLVAECLKEAGSVSTLTEHNWGSALKTKAPVTVAHEAFDRAYLFKYRTMLAESFAKAEVDAEAFFGALVRSVDVKDILSESATLNELWGRVDSPLARMASGLGQRFFGKGAKPTTTGGFAGQDWSKGAVRQKFGQQQKGFQQAMTAAKNFEASLANLGASKPSIDKFMHAIYNALNNFGQKRFGAGAAAPPSRQQQAKRYGDQNQLGYGENAPAAQSPQSAPANPPQA